MSGKTPDFDFVFAPHKSVSLAAEFAPTEAERQMIRNAIHAASDDALQYAARDLGLPLHELSSWDGIQTTPVGSPPQRSVPISA